MFHGKRSAMFPVKHCGTLYIVVRPLIRHKLHIAFIKGHEKHQILTISALIKVENLHRLGV